MDPPVRIPSVPHEIGKGVRRPVAGRRASRGDMEFRSTRGSGAPSGAPCSTSGQASAVTTGRRSDQPRQRSPHRTPPATVAHRPRVCRRCPGTLSPRQAREVEARRPTAPARHRGDERSFVVGLRLDAFLRRCVRWRSARSDPRPRRTRRLRVSSAPNAQQNASMAIRCSLGEAPRCSCRR